jgi:long-chain acyl-CoA synthetase
MAWRQTMARFGSQPAIFGKGGEVLRTFVQIGLEAVKIGKLFDRIPAHSIVAVQIGNSERLPEVLLALWRKQLIPLPLGEMGATELAITLGTVRATAYLTNDGGPLIVHRRPVPDDVTRWLGPVPELLKLTSGTTSAPRAVRFRASQLLADCQNICETMRITEHDVNFGVIPFSHSYGFSSLITPLLVRGVKLVVSDERLPRAVLEGILDTNATVLPATPMFYQKFTETPHPPQITSLRLCISAGAPLSPQSARLFSARFGLKIHAFYGASECGGIAYDASEKCDYDEGFVGLPLQGVKVVQADEAGPISVTGSAVGDGYFPHPEEAILGGGCFVPSDLVRRTGLGLSLVGRTSDIINVSGRKLNPLEVEARLAEFPGVKQAIVFGVESSQRGEEPIACVVGEAVTRDALLHFCHEKLSAWKIPRDVWLVGEIPSNERGKISRRALAENYLAQQAKLS